MTDLLAKQWSMDVVCTLQSRFLLKIINASYELVCLNKDEALGLITLHVEP
jgi:hypothetical protein